MVFNDQKSWFARFVVILALLAGMFGMTPVRPAHAATIMVTNTNASGPGSFAAAVANAVVSDTTVTFDPSLAGQTITLNSQIDLLSLSSLTIDGSGLNPPVIVSGGNTSGILKLGGAMTVSISNITFTNGISDTGGAIEITGATQLTVDNSVFSQNQASSSGGAIAASANSAVTITNSTFDQNQTGGSGGALQTSGNGITTIVNSTFSNNTAGGDGGALRSPNLTIRDSTFSRNIAGGDGGAIHSIIFEIKNTTIDRNRADFAGGAMEIMGNGHGMIVDSTIAQNEAGLRGGAIFTQGNTIVDVLNSTFAGNDAPLGTEVSAFGIATVALSNSILACVPGDKGCIDTAFGSVGGPNTIIATGIFASFGLAELADNGGPTQTMALLPGSPLIDAGDDTICADARVNNLDQRGVTRPQGSHCDIGAYEYNGQDSTIKVNIGNAEMGSYLLSSNQSLRRSYLGINNGPVKVINTHGFSIMASERVISKVDNIATSFSELMGLPNNQVDTTYWLPWYNSKDLNTQLRIANISAGEATVYVSIGGTPVTGSPFTIAAGASRRLSFPGIDNGPVKIQSNVDIVAAERVIYRVNGVDTSYSEMMALPAKQVDTIYWLPWYNSKDLDTQLRIANVSGSSATVHVSIGGTPVTGNPFTIPAGVSKRLSFPNIDKGPVKIESNVDIVAAERVIYKAAGDVAASFTEMMALPNSRVDTVFGLPWYNSQSLNTQLRIANVSSSDATVHISVGGTAVTGSPFSIPAGGSKRLSFPNIDTGPVQIESNVEIIASERVIYTVNNVATSFSEMMGLPDNQLDTIYWFPWYNNKDLNTQLRFGAP